GGLETIAAGIFDAELPRAENRGGVAVVAQHFAIGDAVGHPNDLTSVGVGLHVDHGIVADVGRRVHAVPAPDLQPIAATLLPADPIVRDARFAVEHRVGRERRFAAVPEDDLLR